MVANTGVGDVAETIATHQVGTAVTRFDEAAYGMALGERDGLLADPGTPARCRQAAEADFALSDAISRYDDIYRGLGGQGAYTPAAEDDPAVSTPH